MPGSFDNVSEETKALVNHAVYLRGTVITSYAHIEFLLADICLKAWQLGEYAHLAGTFPYKIESRIAAARAEFIASGKEMATRSASGAVLDHLAAAIPELLGGSADLTPSNNTRAKGMIEIRPGEYNGTYMQLAALRAIPHLAVYRPGDPVETAECWEAILNIPRQAALMALSRQPMPLLRREPGNENKSAKGGYILLEAEGGERKLTILSTGSELHLAVQARDILQKQGVAKAVVSMPCRLLFEQQGPAYKKAVLGTTRARVAVEAAVEHGWERYIGLEGGFVGMHSFGASGKIADVYKKFDINAEAVVRAAHWRRLPLYDIGDPDVGRSRPAASAPSGPVNVSR